MQRCQQVNHTDCVQVRGSEVHVSPAHFTHIMPCTPRTQAAREECEQLRRERDALHAKVRGWRESVSNLLFVHMYTWGAAPARVLNMAAVCTCAVEISHAVISQAHATMLLLPSLLLQVAAASSTCERLAGASEGLQHEAIAAKVGGHMVHAFAACSTRSKRWLHPSVWPPNLARLSGLLPPLRALALQWAVKQRDSALTQAAAERQEVAASAAEAHGRARALAEQVCTTRRGWCPHKSLGNGGC